MSVYLRHSLTLTDCAPTSFTHPAAVLAIAFGSSPNTAFSGGLDKRVRQYVRSLMLCPCPLGDDRWDLETGQCRVLGKHDDAISTLVWCAEHSTSLASTACLTADTRRRPRYWIMGLHHQSLGPVRPFPPSRN